MSYARCTLNVRRRDRNFAQQKIQVKYESRSMYTCICVCALSALLGSHIQLIDAIVGRKICIPKKKKRIFSLARDKQDFVPSISKTLKTKRI